MSKSFFEKYPENPSNYTGINNLVKMVDALGFRYHVSLSGLRPEDFTFDPGGGVLNIEALVQHIGKTTMWLAKSIGANRSGLRAKTSEEWVNLGFEELKNYRDKLLTLKESDLENIKTLGQPFWNMISGPMADALTHVGQINSFRRLNGNPIKSTNYFTGN